MICPECKEGRLLYLASDTGHQRAYDYVVHILWIYLKCEKCGTVRKQRETRMIGTQPVTTAERRRAGCLTSS